MACFVSDSNDGAQVVSSDGDCGRQMIFRDEASVSRWTQKPSAVIQLRGRTGNGPSEFPEFFRKKAKNFNSS
jgi:hypothetical protein